MGEKLVSILSSNLIRRFYIRLDGYYSKARYSVAQKNHYDALGIAPNATQNEIKSAFYKLSLQYHPDKDTSTGAKERFQEISQAYEVLSNYELRRQYDIRMKVVNSTKSNVKKHSNPKSDFIVRPPKSGRIYDFDEWTRQHYSETLNKQREFKDKFDRYKRSKREDYVANPLPTLTSFIILVLCLACSISVIEYTYVYKENADRDASKPESLV